MTAPATQLPEDAALATARGDLVSQASALVVSSQEQYEGAAAFVLDVKALIARVRATFDPIVAAANQAHKIAVAKRAEHLGPLTTAELTAKGHMGRYEQAEERRIAEERARLEREHREAEALRQADERRIEEETRLREAEALEAAGMGHEALAVLAAPMPEPDPIPPPPPPVPIARPSAAGISSRDLWKAEVTSLAALVRAIAEGKADLALVKEDQAQLNALARMTKGSRQVPGVRFWPENSISGRTT